jgi:5'/3'-nucleotidase SurE
LCLEERSYASLPGVPVYAVEAAPAYIVRAAAAGGFGPPPDVVISGINNGVNTGHAILHSGTVGAALTAATYGQRRLAVSIGAAPEPHWATAAAYARRAHTSDNLDAPVLARSLYDEVRAEAPDLDPLPEPRVPDPPSEPTLF